MDIWSEHKPMFFMLILFNETSGGPGQIPIALSAIGGFIFSQF